ncbi:D-lactate dehydrogenase (cytochrome) [Aneurinibacillus soli]|uniref:D-lactate dehydrogenase (cytochrome) n=1 Tax=Aneurinibacillus soli TaxID=1500254 RepID=A0A0U5AWU4_9BACL|nr:FAD-linked oxidase C-terminal domain-containing protein [Aneurinibacillus soli]PYE59320.1 D-lactate dehydrogenase (cytochrome) [Aneurinibacillus soli]BAU26690.1 putative FAD-linked oxidoreductase [Aneurinibacillus soli]
MNERMIKELQELLSPEQVSVNSTVLEQHAKDESHHPSHLPDVVVFPTCTEDVSRVLTWANENRVPVVPFGVGSGLEGQAIPYQGGISLDFQQMNHILEIRAEDMLVRVQPGVTRMQLNRELKKHGLFFSVDPGADATLGGMAATNASGTTSVRYGIMRDQVRDLEVVLVDGRVIRTGGKSAKSSSGYHLTGLFVGSEGTLGVFTELTLRLYGIPEATMSARASFPAISDAVNTAYAIMAAGIPVARLELVDARSIRQVNTYKGTTYPESATLFLEFHGNEAGLKQDIAFARELADEQQCTAFVFESESLGQAALWEARHHMAYAFMHGYPGRGMLTTDVCVPLSELTGAIAFAEEQLASTGMIGAIVGHVGDGNFHTLLMIDKTNPQEVEQAEKVNDYIVNYALERGGTCTGEHGVGIGKIKYQEKEHGTALDVMRSMKEMFDPQNILNPGKILPL